MYTCIVLFSLYAGPNYVRPNQSWFRPSDQRQMQIQREHNCIMNKVISHLFNYCHIPRQSPIIQQFASRLQLYLIRIYMTPLSVTDEIRARQELNLVKSIRRKLAKMKLVLRQTDKSLVFHIGQSSDYERKAAEYRAKTQAYMELSSNPLNEIFDKVTRLLNNLRSKKQILAWQYKKMMPDRRKVKLGHMYFLPKSHKVVVFLLCDHE